jgi:hypothetical protein
LTIRRKVKTGQRRLNSQIDKSLSKTNDPKDLSSTLIPENIQPDEEFLYKHLLIKSSLEKLPKKSKNIKNIPSEDESEGSPIR